MSLSPMDKLRIHKELKANKAALNAATKPLEKLQLHKERKALWSKLKVNSSPSTPEPNPVAEPAPAENNLQNPMLEQYREGGFNNQPAEKFKLTMQQVYDLGMPVDEVGAGMVDWFRSNTDQLAA